MAVEHSARKLAVIVHADVVGSTALVRRDETLAHERIKDVFQRFSETIESYGGTAHELRGDALVAEFDRASDAISAGIAFQVENAEFTATLEGNIRPVLRIGISMGEVVIADNTVTGEGVVLAQRLEQLANSGGVVIQGAAYETVPNRLPFDYQSLGEQELKGFEEPVRAYAVAMQVGETIPVPERRTDAAETRNKQRIPPWVAGGAVAFLVMIGGLTWLYPWKPELEPAPEEQKVLPLSDKPSIAVLPFRSLSDDPEQEYFSDGITNDLITDLSKYANLLVIASNSVFVYKGKPKNLKEIGKELNVRYVLEGSVEKIDNRVRINAQLIDAITDHHMWAERYDRQLNDIFVVRDEIAKAIVSELEVLLTEDEQARMEREYTHVVQAYDLFLRGRSYLRGTRQAHLKARKLFDQAIALDPEFAAAYAEKSFSYFSSFIMPMMGDPKILDAAEVAAQRAVAIDDTLPLTHARLGWVYFSKQRHKEAIAHARRAVELGPNDAESYAQLGNILNWSGKPKEGIAAIEKAIRLNPHYPFYYLFYLGHAYYLLGNNEDSIALMERVVTRAPTFLPVRRHLAVLYQEQGRKEEARAQVTEVLRIFPGASIEDTRQRCLYVRDASLLGRFFDGLRKSGMPEGIRGKKAISMD